MELILEPFILERRLTSDVLLDSPPRHQYDIPYAADVQGLPYSFTSMGFQTMRYPRDAT